ncbi:hypothetical protein B4U79_12950, partial [Dinothrombium tinctorium]
EAPEYTIYTSESFSGNEFDLLSLSSSDTEPDFSTVSRDNIPKTSERDRLLILKLISVGKSVAEVSRLTNFSRNTIYKWAKRFEDTGLLNRIKGSVRSRYDPSYIIHDASRGPTVNFHGWISINGRGDLNVVSSHFNSSQYLQLLDEKVLPAIRQQSGGRYIFMHDNASIHKANIVRSYLEKNGIPLLSWPALSPDLNPIENVWAIFAQKIRKHVRRNGPIRDRSHMIEIANESWSQISSGMIKKLYSSLPKRMEMVHTREGGPIGY